MYRTVSQLDSVIDFLAQTAPQLCTKVELPNRSIQGRPIFALRVRNDNGAKRPKRPGVLIVGGMHARELMNPDAIVELALDIVRCYLTATDLPLGGRLWSKRVIKKIVETLDIWMLPCANPDGREYVMTVNNLWRQNRRDNPSTNCEGVDVNRNLDFVWGVTAGPTSCNPCDETYVGSAAFSEPESVNIQYLCDTFGIDSFVDVHSFSELVLFPWGHARTQTNDPTKRFTNLATGTCAPLSPPSHQEFMLHRDLSRFQRMARRIVGDIQAVRGRTYTSGSIFGTLYATTGTSTDYVFSRHIAKPALQKTYSFVFETGPFVNNVLESFQPADPGPVKLDTKSGLLSLMEQSTTGGLLFYKRSTGEGLFVTTDANGNIGTLQQHTDWDRDWDLIVPGSFGGNGYTGLLLYKRSTGEALFTTSDGSGNVATLQQHLNWDKDWDLIVPGNFGGGEFTGLFLYKRSTGEALFTTSDGSGNVTTLQQHLNWDKDWDLIVPGNFGGSEFTGLFLYKRSTGEALFTSTDGSGNVATLQQHLNWDKDWDLIVPGNFDGSKFTGLLLYKRSTGEALFTSTDGNGNVTTLQQHTNWDKDWDLIIPGNFGESDFTGLLLYKRATGEGLFLTTDGSGNVATLQQHTDWDKDWNLIVPGNFGS